MRLSEVHIRKYRRFVDLAVTGISPAARLIVLLGPNGVGKSAFLDALVTYGQYASRGAADWDDDYHARDRGHDRAQRRQNMQSAVQMSFHDQPQPNQNKLVYARSAYRIEASFSMSQLTQQPNPLQSPRSGRMINVDAAVSRNYQRLVAQIVAGVAQSAGDDVTHQSYHEAIASIREPLQRIFPDLTLEGIGNPLENGTFEFTKGDATNFKFLNLSGGEKAVFDLILDLVLAKENYNDTLYCIDEPEGHLHARLQSSLLDELYALLPPNCQMLLATHSIGMVRRALELDRANPGLVCFLDFGGNDFDQPQRVVPAQPSRKFWKQQYAVALGDLAALVAPGTVVICEGQPQGTPGARHPEVDARCYRAIFAGEFPDAEFVSLGNDNDVLNDRIGLAESLEQLMSAVTVIRVLDRDDRGSQETAAARQSGTRILSRRNLEEYMYDDEVLEALALDTCGEDHATQLIESKRAIIEQLAHRGRVDLKDAAGQMYNACKDILGLKQCGNNAVEFMPETLANHIKPGMAVYGELKDDIFGA